VCILIGLCVTLRYIVSWRSAPLIQNKLHLSAVARSWVSEQIWSELCKSISPRRAMRMHYLPKFRPLGCCPPKTEGPKCRCRCMERWDMGFVDVPLTEGLDFPGKSWKLLKGPQCSAQMCKANFTLVTWMGTQGMVRAPSMLAASSQNNSRMTRNRMSHLSARFCGPVPRTKLGYSKWRKKTENSSGEGKSMTFMRKRWAQQCIR